MEMVNYGGNEVLSEAMAPPGSECSRFIILFKSSLNSNVYIIGLQLWELKVILP